MEEPGVFETNAKTCAILLSVAAHCYSLLSVAVRCCPLLSVAVRCCLVSDKQGSHFWSPQQTGISWWLSTFLFIVTIRFGFGGVTALRQ